MSLRLDWATHKAAKYACENWHYSGCIPKGALVQIGVWEFDKYIGCVIFGRGATDRLGSPYGLKNTEVCELVRIALKKHAATVSKIISIAIRFLLKSSPNLKLIVSFADPSEKHNGAIYQASNWTYSGKSEDCFYPVINGKVTHPRQLSHLKKSGVIKDRKSVKHIMKPGKYRYLYPLTDDMRVLCKKLAKPYPKRAVSKENVAVDYQSAEGGVNPTTALQTTTD
jgi:hypothetical protein